MPKLLIATTNRNKFREIKELLSLPYDIISLNDISLDIMVEESGKTYEENAIIKSRLYGDRSQLLTLSDDSGLEIDALGGRPGIRSARYAEGTDRDRLERILDEMKNIPEEKRTARYRIIISLYNPKNKQVKTFEGVSEGRITEKPVGENGFGYDPIFYSFDLKKTNGEATFEEKNTSSHRSKAVASVKEWLMENVNRVR